MRCWQFSLKTALLIVTVVAIFLGLDRAFPWLKMLVLFSLIVSVPELAFALLLIAIGRLFAWFRRAKQSPPELEGGA